MSDINAIAKKRKVDENESMKSVEFPIIPHFLFVNSCVEVLCAVHFHVYFVK